MGVGTHSTLGRATGTVFTDINISRNFSSSQTPLFREACSDHLSESLYQPQSCVLLFETLVTS